MSLLYSPTSLGSLKLQNRMVMAPLTRRRAIGNLPAGAALNPPDADTFYTPGPKGYTDYPALAG
jgi:hypothetical protein